MPTFDDVYNDAYYADLLTDMAEFRKVLLATLIAIPEEAWALRTGTREKDWTLKELVAHLAAIAGVFNEATNNAIVQAPFYREGITQRRDLRAFNAAEIEARREETALALCETLLLELERAATIVKGITPQEAERTLQLPIYNRPARAIDFMHWQLSHIGGVHAAQITRPLGLPPLWEQYTTPMTHRQLDRFLRHMSYAYWPEFGGGATHTLNFTVEGAGGGEWHIIADDTGGSFGSGLLDDAQHHFIARAPNILFSVFTLTLRINEAVEKFWLRVESPDLIRSLRLLSLFTASPPRKGLPPA